MSECLNKRKGSDMSTITKTVRITIKGFGYDPDVPLKQSVFDALDDDLQGRYGKQEYIDDEGVIVEVLED